MTRMLASVCTIKEAQIVLREGVDIIDLKDPKSGALGALDLDTISSVVKLVDDDLPTSATIGDISSDNPKIKNRIIDVAATGVDYVKVGLFSKKITKNFLNAIKESSAYKIKIVIVVFAEDLEDVKALEPIIKSDIQGIMLDTKNKSRLNLCSLVELEHIEKFIQLGKSYNLITGLAGSINHNHIDRLLPLRPDYLGFRGALCVKRNRISSIDALSVKKIKDIIHKKKLIDCDNGLTKEVLINGSMA